MTLDLDWHIHARVDLIPVSRDVAQNPPVFPFSVGAALPPGPDDFPESPMWDARVLTGISPRFSLGVKNVEEDKNEEDYNEDDRQGRGNGNQALFAIDSYLDREVINPVGSDKRVNAAYLVFSAGRV